MEVDISWPKVCLQGLLCMNLLCIPHGSFFFLILEDTYYNLTEMFIISFEHPCFFNHSAEVMASRSIFKPQFFGISHKMWCLSPKMIFHV